MKTARIHPERGRPEALARLAASNAATLALLAILGLSVVLYYRLQVPGRLWLLALPSLLLIVNFALALALRGILRNNWPLLVFHFALIALVLLAFASRLSAFRATLELTRGETFGGQLQNVQRGPWHRDGLAQTRFTNLGYEIRYRPGIKRDRTVNRIALIGPDGGSRIVEIGDHVPLVVGHYRIYTSHNKGYAPVFEWRAEGDAPAVVGSVHLPAYPAHQFGQALEWQIPGSDLSVWTMLAIEDEIMPADREFMFGVPARHHLVLRHGARRVEMRPGDEVALPGGVLRYIELSTWMGYKVDYDWTRPWLLAIAIVGIVALFVHYADKFMRPRRRPVAQSQRACAPTRRPPASAARDGWPLVP